MQKNVDKCTQIQTNADKLSGDSNSSVDHNGCTYLEKTEQIQQNLEREKEIKREGRREKESEVEKQNSFIFIFNIYVALLFLPPKFWFFTSWA